MSFILEGWARASVSYNKDAPRSYNYVNTEDDLIVILAANYFIAQQTILAVNDVINLIGKDGNVKVRVDTVDIIVSVTLFTQDVSPDSSPTFNELHLKNLNGAGAITFSTTPLGQEPVLQDTPAIFVDGVNDSMSIGTLSPDPAAKLDLSSTTQGFLLPRMTQVQRDAISSPPDGLMIFNIDANLLNVRIAGVWRGLVIT